MDRRVVLGSIAAVAFGGGAAWLLQRGGDEAQIRAALDRLAKVIRVAQGDTPVGREARIKTAFDELFVERPSVDIPELPDARPGRIELVRLASAAQGLWSTLEVELGQVRVTIDPEGPGLRGASVEASATLRGARAGADEQRDARRVSFRLVKDGGWKITSVTVYPP
jgi:hypothetical protein